MDITAMAGMLFSLLVVLIIAGSILMFPLMRQLGKMMGQRIEERRSADLPAGEARALLEGLESLQTEVARLAERQAFTERLLEGDRTEPGAGPSNAATAADPDGEARPAADRSRQAGAPGDGT